MPDSALAHQGTSFTLSLVFCCALVLAPAVSARAPADTCEDARTLARKSIALFNRNPIQALEGLQKASRDCPGDRSISYNLALGLYRTNDREQSFEIFRRLSEADADACVYANTGWLALQLGKGDEAALWAAKCLERSPDDAGCLCLMLSSLAERGDFIKALEVLARNGAVLPASCRAQTVDKVLAHARGLCLSGKGGEAAEFLTGLAAIAPGIGALEEARDLLVASVLDGSEPTLAPAPAKGRAALSRSSRDLTYMDEIPPGPVCSVDSYALLIGISRYRLQQGRASSADDARRLSAMITAFCDFAGGTRHVRVRTDREADSAAVKSDLAWLMENARQNPKARILFYFAGLSAPGEKDGDLFLACYDSPAEPPYNGSGLSVSELLNLFSGLPNQDFTAIMDTCRQPSGNRRPPCRGAPPPPVAGNKNILFAAGSDCAGESGRKSAFSQFLFKALSGAADADHDGWVDTSEAFLYINEMISDTGPCLEAFFSGDLPLRLARVSSHEN
ncbi:MAG: tetratricopeptide repeat protein [Thermodesulfobacteriota bacterium]